MVQINKRKYCTLASYFGRFYTRNDISLVQYRRTNIYFHQLFYEQVFFRTKPNNSNNILLPNPEDRNKF